jgi:hypothetical protein
MLNSYTRDGTRDSTPLPSTTFTSIQGILCNSLDTVANYTLFSMSGQACSGWHGTTQGGRCVKERQNRKWPGGRVDERVSYAPGDG